MPKFAELEPQIFSDYCVYRHPNFPQDVYDAFVTTLVTHYRREVQEAATLYVSGDTPVPPENIRSLQIKPESSHKIYAPVWPVEDDRTSTRQRRSWVYVDERNKIQVQMNGIVEKDTGLSVSFVEQTDMDANDKTEAPPGGTTKRARTED